MENSFVSHNADEIAKNCSKQLEASTDYKQPRMEQIAKYEQLYENKIAPKLRQMFNIPVPVFSGLIDTLASAFDDPIQLKYVEQDPADYLRARKITAAWEIETSSARPDALWDMKLRWDRKLAIINGRGILKYYAESDPKYASVFDVVDLKYFHFEPKGGGHLGKHLFKGQEGIYKTREQLIEAARNGTYNAGQVQMLIESHSKGEYKEEIGSAYQEKMARFRALNLDPESNNYVGQELFHLCEWVTTFKGEQWYVVFDPFYRIWVRMEPLKEVFSAGYEPWVSWATHEDPINFLSKSFADDFYQPSLSIIDLVNQEFTNRQKQNLGSKLYDKEMIKNLELLDSAQWRPDSLVPVDTIGGARKLSEALYEIKTPELSGTINLISWFEQMVGREVGVTDILQGGTQKQTKKPNVIFQEMQAVNKRLDYRSAPYTGVMSEIGLRFIQGLKDHLGEGIAIKMLGEEGYEWDKLKRIDLNTKRDVEIKVVSSKSKAQADKLKSDKKLKVLTLLAQSQNINAKWRDEQLLRLGEWEDSDISVAMDTQNYGDREILAEASAAIQELIAGREPDMNFGANTMYMKKIVKFATEHRKALGMKKFNMFIDFAMKHETIAAENMARIAGKIRSTKGLPQGEDVNAPGQEETPSKNPAAVPAPKVDLNKPAPTGAIV